jgi:hypothetical protein
MNWNEISVIESQAVSSPLPEAAVHMAHSFEAPWATSRRLVVKGSVRSAE